MRFQSHWAQEVNNTLKLKCGGLVQWLSSYEQLMLLRNAGVGSQHLCNAAHSCLQLLLQGFLPFYVRTCTRGCAHTHSVRMHRCVLTCMHVHIPMHTPLKNTRVYSKKGYIIRLKNKSKKHSSQADIPPLRLGCIKILRVRVSEKSAGGCVLGLSLRKQENKARPRGK